MAVANRIERQSSRPGSIRNLVSETSSLRRPLLPARSAIGSAVASTAMQLRRAPGGPMGGQSNGPLAKRYLADGLSRRRAGPPHRAAHGLAGGGIVGRRAGRSRVWPVRRRGLGVSKSSSSMMWLSGSRLSRPLQPMRCCTPRAHPGRLARWAEGRHCGRGGDHLPPFTRMRSERLRSIRWRSNPPSSCR